MRDVTPTSKLAPASIHGVHTNLAIPHLFKVEELILTLGKREIGVISVRSMSSWCDLSVIGAILGCDLGEVEGVIWALGSWRDLGSGFIDKVEGCDLGAIRSRSRSCILLSSKNSEVKGFMA